ncbi:MAG: WecB/TagA/CpsF family glycosyltransferase [Raineya sp.]
MTPRKKVISLELSLITYQEALEAIGRLAAARQSAYACFANAHMTIEAHQNPQFATQVNQAGFVFADGVPLRWALRWLYGIKQERIAGMDFMESIVSWASQNHLKIFLYGSTDEVLKAIAQRINQEYASDILVGSISPPFRPLSEEEQNKMIEQINGSGANLVLVALGCPKQEAWMATYSHQIQAVCLGVGGAFPVFAKMQSRAPMFLQKFGLEWLYRLYQEPKRLWKRYFFTNSLFVYLLLKQKFFKHS